MGHMTSGLGGLAPFFRRFLPLLNGYTPFFQPYFGHFWPSVNGFLPSPSGWACSDFTSLYCLHVYQPQKINCDIQNQLYGWLLFAVVGIGEEIICRGIAFRLLCDRIGMAWALILSAVIFGFAHIFNDGATVWSALAIAVTSGWLLGVAYVINRYGHR